MSTFVLIWATKIVLGDPDAGDDSNPRAELQHR
jgi:hypothetical protein